MKRQLSTKLTILAKIILPGLWLFIVGLITLMAFLGLEPKSTSQPLPKFLLLGMLIGGATIYYFTVMKFMAVAVDNRFLYVSNFLKEVSIPLSNVRNVTEIVWLRGNPVTIHLRTPSEFGSKITFIPKSKGFTKSLQSHPVVAELRQMTQTKIAEAS